MLKIEHTFPLQGTLFRLYMTEHGPCGVWKHIQSAAFDNSLYFMAFRGVKIEIIHVLVKIDSLEEGSGTGR